jgi:zinc protease
MYHVGSSREVPGKTGFAHLFEHLLFGGSENVPSGTFDKIIEGAGGSNNGFTERDITTYLKCSRRMRWKEYYGLNQTEWVIS